jgi:hypothetical protein
VILFQPIVDDRVRLHPLDPKTSRHAGECEFASAGAGRLKCLEGKWFTTNEGTIRGLRTALGFPELHPVIDAPLLSGRLPAACRRAPLEGPVLLAVDQQLGEGATLRVAPELSDPVGSLEVRAHEDVEQLGAGSGTEGV